MRNELLDSDAVVATWLDALPRISARLYERAIDVWEQFEPARKRLTESLGWLDYEGELEIITTTVTDALHTLETRLPNVAPRWRNAAIAANEALGDTTIQSLLRAAPAESRS